MKLFSKVQQLMKVIGVLVSFSNVKFTKASRVKMEKILKFYLVE